MTRSEFMAMSARPSLSVTWGGKQYKLTSVEHKTNTCWLKPLGSTKKSIAVGFEYVILSGDKIKRKPRSKKQSNNA